ncbi:19437_t:CDS:2, partial [Racocetra fulgida]
APTVTYYCSYRVHPNPSTHYTDYLPYIHHSKLPIQIARKGCDLLLVPTVGYFSSDYSPYYRKSVLPLYSDLAKWAPMCADSGFTQLLYSDFV